MFYYCLPGSVCTSLPITCQSFLPACFPSPSLFFYYYTTQILSLDCLHVGQILYLCDNVNWQNIDWADTMNYSCVLFFCGNKSVLLESFVSWKWGPDFATLEVFFTGWSFALVTFHLLFLLSMPLQAPLVWPVKWFNSLIMIYTPHINLPCAV